MVLKYPATIVVRRLTYPHRSEKPASKGISTVVEKATRVRILKKLWRKICGEEFVGEKLWKVGILQSNYGEAIAKKEVAKCAFRVL